MVCARAKVRLESLVVHYSQADVDPGANAEWFLDIVVEGGGSSQSWRWSNAYVKDNQTFQLSKEFLVDLPNNKTSIKVSCSGYEEDDFSPNDDLEYGERYFGSQTDWDIGASQSLSAGDEEGSYTLNFSITCVAQSSGLTEDVYRYSGLWRAGSDAQQTIGLDKELNWDGFESKWEELSKQGWRLIDIGSSSVGGQRKYQGIFNQGSDGHALWANVEWPTFVSKWQELSKQGLRLVDIDTYTDGNKRLWSGVFRSGQDKHYLWGGVDWLNFVSKWQELSKQGLRLIDLETYVDGNKRLYTGVFRQGNDGHALWAGLDWQKFKAKWQDMSSQGLRLIDLQTYTDDGKTLYNGVFRAGNYKHYLFSGLSRNQFKEKCDTLHKQNYRLINMDIYRA